MGKYSFDRLAPDTFEAMTKSLLQQEFGLEGDLVIFGHGKDGGREAVWSQAPTHKDYTPPFVIKDGESKINREWVFQVKFHDTNISRSKSPVEALVDDLRQELNKITQKHAVLCHSYVLITNIALTGVRYVGGRDKITQAANKWKGRIQDVQVWDTAKISALLDAHPGVRRTYLDSILPSDLLAALLNSMQQQENHMASVIRTYLSKVIDAVGNAKSDEAGDDADSQLRLEDVYTDLTLSLGTQTRDGDIADVAKIWSDFGLAPSNRSLVPSRYPQQVANVAFPSRTSASASVALLLAPNVVTMLEAGPGFGKSTLCQFVVIYHAARLCGAEGETTAKRLSARISLPPSLTLEDVDSMCKPRLPFRVELRRYADWRTSEHADGLAQYIAEKIINPDADASLTKEDVYSILRTTPALLVLDGLDEVPNKESRAKIIGDAETFIRRARDGERVDLQVIVSTRPQGYNNEFDQLLPLSWTIDELSKESFYNYCDLWLGRRVSDGQERADALSRVKSGMTSPEVRRLALTLLQATVILTIAKNKHDIPHERSGLFAKYVAVIFDREKVKFPLVKQYEAELYRLHELTGYELHRRMEQGESGSIHENDFRDIVLRVWDTYRGDEPLPSGIRKVVDDIIDTARDRLVFLKGEGPKQEEIGFLISSFREFFAARHLNVHEDSDREKVFDSLLRRDFHWENVLLFYAGFQEAGDQRRWIDYLRDQDNDGARSVDVLVLATRFRRMLLKLLPEFRGLSKRTFETAIKEALNGETIWTWFQVEWAVDILCTLRGGDGLAAIVAFLKVAAFNKNIPPRAALTLYGRIVERVGSERSAFAKLLSELAEESAYGDAIAESAFRFDVPVDLERIPREACVLAVERCYESVRTRKELSKDTLRYVSSSLLLEVLVRAGTNVSFFLGHSILAKLIELQGLNRIGPRPVRLVARGSLGTPFRVKQYFARGDLIGIGEQPYYFNPLSIVGALGAPELQGSDVGRYLLSLAEALGNPLDPDLNSKAYALEAELRFIVSHRYGCRDLLGPALASFSTPEDWLLFKTKLVKKNAKSWLRRIKSLQSSAESKRDFVVFLLFVHPRGWSQLEKDGVVSRSAIEAAERSGLRSLLEIPKEAIDVVEVVYLSSASQDLRGLDLELGSILRSGIEIACSVGSSSLARSPWLRQFAASSRFKPSVPTEFAELCDKVDLLMDMSLDWVAALVILGIRTPDRDVDRLLRMWKRVEAKPPAGTLLSYDRINLRQLVSELLDREEGVVATTLAAWIVSATRTSIYGQKDLAARLLSRALGEGLTEYQFYLVLDALGRLPLFASECAVWTEAKNVDRIAKSPMLLELVCNRIRGALRPPRAPDDSAFRRQLEAIVDSVGLGSLELATVALERLKSVADAQTKVIADADWQVR